MKLLLLLLLPYLVISQEFQPIEVKSNVGTIVLSENYIHFDHCGVQRIKLIHDNKCCVDLFAWTWRSRGFEYCFDSWNEDIYLIKVRNDKMIQKYKVLKYKYK